MSDVNRLGYVCLRPSVITTMTMLAALAVPAIAGADAVHYGYVWKNNSGAGRWEEKANWNCINPAGGNCSANPAENKGYPNVAGDQAYFNASIITRSMSVSVFRSDIRVAKVVFGNADVDILPERWDPLESTCRHASLSIL